MWKKCIRWCVARQLLTSGMRHTRYLEPCYYLNKYYTLLNDISPLISPHHSQSTLFLICVHLLFKILIVANLTFIHDLYFYHHNSWCRCNEYCVCVRVCARSIFLLTYDRMVCVYVRGYTIYILIYICSLACACVRVRARLILYISYIFLRILIIS